MKNRECLVQALAKAGAATDAALADRILAREQVDEAQDVLNTVNQALLKADQAWDMASDALEVYDDEVRAGKYQ